MRNKHSRHLFVSLWLGLGSGISAAVLLLVLIYKILPLLPHGITVTAAAFTEENTPRLVALAGFSSFASMASFYLVMMTIAGIAEAIYRRVVYGDASPKM